jgi:hypothetical protein
MIMETLLSLVLVFAIAVSAIFLALNMGKPAIDISRSSSDLREAETIMKFMDNYIREAAAEGNGSSRRFVFASPGTIDVLKGENAVVFMENSYPELFDYNTRARSGNLLYIGGSDVRCHEDGGRLILENSFVKFAFNKTARTENLSSIDTTNAIMGIELKSRGIAITPVNSSIVIDGKQESSRGTGYSELLSSGNGLPFCTAHFYVSSPVAAYDVYYRLYSGADFIDVRIIPGE